MAGNSTLQADSSATSGIQLRHLRYFLAVLEERHFRRAAERLHISQPPLSQAIQQLEEELGVQLFERTSHGVAATEAGLVFGEEARKVLAAVEVAVTEARRAGGIAAGLRIGCTPHFPIGRIQLFMAPLLGRLRTTQATVVHAPSPEQFRRLRTGELDLGIVHVGTEEPEVELEPLFVGDRLEICLRAEHELAQHDVLRPEDLRDEVLWLLPRGVLHGLHDRTLALLGGAGYSFRQIGEVGGTDPRDVILTVATQGGVAVAPEWVRQEETTDGLLTSRPTAPPIPAPEVAVAWRANPPAHLRAAVSAARDVARELHDARSRLFAGAEAESDAR